MAFGLPNTKTDAGPLPPGATPDNVIAADDFNKLRNSIATPDGALVTATGSTVPRTLADWAADILANSGRYARQYPLFVENFADWAAAGTGTPNGLTNGTLLSTGNYQLTYTITGVAGQQVLSVQTGDLNQAGVTGSWACVIKHDDGTWGVYAVTAVNVGGATMTIKPYLKKPATIATLASLGSSALGQHYGTAGYSALAEHIWNYPAYKAYRQKWIARHDETVAGNGPWTIGSMPDAWFEGAQVANIDMGVGNSPNATCFSARNSKYVLVQAQNNNQPVYWTQALYGKTGYLDTYLGPATVNNLGILVTVVIDGATVYSKTIMGLERITVPFVNATTGTITIKPLEGDGGASYKWRLGTTTWWELPSDIPTNLFFDGAKVVFLGDSWGEFYSGWLPAELGTRIVARGGTMTNSALSGQTSAWGLANFASKVLAYDPDICVIEFFTNDQNSLSLPVWQANMAALIDLCIQHNIQPVIVMPAPTSSTSQTQNHAIWSASLAEGVAA